MFPKWRGQGGKGNLNMQEGKRCAWDEVNWDNMVYGGSTCHQWIETRHMKQL